MFRSTLKLLRTLQPHKMGRIQLDQLPASTHVTVTLKSSSGEEHVLADSSLAPGETIMLREGSYTPRYYFPASCIASPSSLTPPVGTKLASWPSGHTSYCPYKGTARYHSITSPQGDKLEGAAWAYPSVENDVKEVTKDGVGIEDKSSFWTWGKNGEKLVLKVDGKVESS